MKRHVNIKSQYITCLIQPYLIQCWFNSAYLKMEILLDKIAWIFNIAIANCMMISDVLMQFRHFWQSLAFKIAQKYWYLGENTDFQLIVWIFLENFGKLSNSACGCCFNHWNDQRHHKLPPGYSHGALISALSNSRLLN